MQIRVTSACVYASLSLPFSFFFSLSLSPSLSLPSVFSPPSLFLSISIYLFIYLFYLAQTYTHILTHKFRTITHKARSNTHPRVLIIILRVDRFFMLCLCVVLCSFYCFVILGTQGTSFVLGLRPHCQLAHTFRFFPKIYEL
jgi:hypothetical protein